MIEYSNLLEEALEAWADARLGALHEADNIPKEEWDYRPTPEVRSVREQVVHILEVAMFMVGELARPDTNLKRQPIGELVAAYAQPAYDAESRDELLALMRTQLDEGIAAFQSAGELHMLQLIERFDGKMGTKLAWLHHGIAQEMYHRAQLTVYARMLGIEPALTKLIRSSH